MPESIKSGTSLPKDEPPTCSYLGGGIYSLRCSTWLNAPRVDVFKFLSNASNNGRVNAPWLVFVPKGRDYEMYEGRMFIYKMRVRGLPVVWHSLISVWKPDQEFRDEQVSGPFAYWDHQHIFKEEQGGTRVVDVVDYRLPFGVLGRVVNWVLVRRELERIFVGRQQNVHRLLDEINTR